MSSNNNNNNTRSSLAWGFLCGAAVTTTVSVMLWTRRQQQQRQRDLFDDFHAADEEDLLVLEEEDEEETIIETENNNNNNNDLLLMDDVNLDLRLIRKAEGVLQMRTSRLIVVIERCVNNHNYSAILRTVEALGIQHVWMIDPPSSSADDGVGSIAAHEQPTTEVDEKVVMDMQGKAIAGGLSVQELEDRNRHRLFAQGATEWLSLRNFATTSECLEALRENRCKIWATDLSQKAVPLTRRALQQAKEWPIILDSSSQCCHQQYQSLAICFGTEAVGCTEELLNAADLRVYLPLRGFADSLNLSVATALVLHHLCSVLVDARGDNIFFGPNGMTNEERSSLRRAWYTKLAQQRLLTSRDKKRRKKLLADITKIEVLQAKMEQDGPKSLTKDQLQKVANLAQMRQEIMDIEASANFLNPTQTNNGDDKPEDDSSSSRNSAERAHYQEILEEWIANPPQPLTDLRRADSHRISYVGKGTKKRSGEHWKGMAAVNANKSKPSHGSSAKYFRKVIDPP